jgi:hypothetical protein
VLDVETALPATGQGERHLGEDLPPVVKRDPATLPRNGRRERIPEPQTVGKTPKSVESDMGHDAGATGFHNHTRRAGTVHFGSALLVRDPVA